MTDQGSDPRRRLSTWDRHISHRLAVVPGSRGRTFALLGAHLGDGWIWAALGLAAWWRGTPALQRGLRRWAGSMALGAAITTTTKNIMRRGRPLEQHGFYSRKYDKHSFPSGHATRMGTIAVWGLLLLPSPIRLMAPAVALWTAWSRVALRVHYTLDVAVGLLIGVVVSIAVWIGSGRQPGPPASQFWGHAADRGERVR